MTDTASDRRTFRFPPPLRVHCSFEKAEGTATLANISYSGALLQDTALQPGVGTPVTLYVFLKQPRAFKGELPSELASVVIRHSSDGFAVKFEEETDLSFADFSTRSAPKRPYTAPLLSDDLDNENAPDLTSRGRSLYLEHETGLEPATPTLAREDQPEQDQ
jgi:hypothetical protein